MITIRHFCSRFYDRRDLDLKIGYSTLEEYRILGGWRVVFLWRSWDL